MVALPSSLRRNISSYVFFLVNGTAAVSIVSESLLRITVPENAPNMNSGVNIAEVLRDTSRKIVSHLNTTLMPPSLDRPTGCYWTV